MPKSTVRVYDFATKKVTTIPAGDLPPGMVEVKVKGVKGRVYADPARLRALLGPELRGRIAKLAETFAEVSPDTLEKWELDFQRDADPEHEVGVWEQMAELYRHFTDGQGLSLDEKKDVFSVILNFSTDGPEITRLEVKPRALPRERVLEIIDAIEKRYPFWDTPEGREFKEMTRRLWQAPAWLEGLSQKFQESRCLTVQSGANSASPAKVKSMAEVLPGLTELTLVFPKVEVIGGPLDGQSHLVNFALDIDKFRGVLDTVDHCVWVRLAQGEPSQVIIEGTFQGQRVRLRMLSAPDSGK